MRKSKQFWLIFLALFYSSFVWGQGKTIITNFSDAGYTTSDNSFFSGGIDFYLSSWNNDQLSYVNQDSFFVYANQADLDINLYNYMNNWVQVVFMTNDTLEVYVEGDMPSDTSSFMFTKIGVKDTLFFNAGIHPFNYVSIGGPEFYVYEVTLNYTLDFYLEKDSICPGERIVADFGEPNVNFIEWIAGDGSPMEKNFHFEHNYINAGVYDLTCIAHNDNQTIDTIVKQVNVITDLVPFPQFWAKMDVGSVCPGDPVQFGVEGDYNSYSWNFGDGSPIDSIDRPAHAFMYDSTYAVSLTVTNACGNLGSDTIPVLIDSKTPAVASFFIGNPDACPHEEVYLEASNSGTFIWDFGDGQKGYNPIVNHAFPDTGNYLVTLVNKNSCGFSDTSSQVINVMYHPERMGNVYVDAGFKSENNQSGGYIEVCPGSPVAFANYTQIAPGDIMYWDFGDSTPISKEFEPVHIYQNSGYYNPRLIVKNNCGAINEYYLSVDVIDSLIPDVILQATPMEICPGEAVYFWDDNFDPAQNYEYDFVFGDGDTLLNIKKLTSSEPKVLAVHNYANTGIFTYSFTATNVCGNSVTYLDTVRVSSDSTKVPFYYVRNTSEQDEHEDIENWGKKFAETDAVLKVPVFWAAWDTTKNDNFFVGVWYGGVDFSNPDIPQPDGVVKVKGNNKVATVFVPMKNGVNSVGVAAFWNCSGTLEGDPSIKGAPVDTILGTQIKSFPIQSGKISNIPKINLESWNGKCFLDWGVADGDWSTDDLGGYQYVLHLWDGQYELEKRENTGNVLFIERGYYDIWDSLFTFNPNYDEQMNTCFEPGNYIVDALNGILTFSLDTLANDLCASRIAIFANKFHKMTPMFDKAGVCPNDPVLFQAIGGTSYDWVFNNTDTLRGSIVDYSFSTVGDYTVNLFASNACGRIDSLYSYVHVADNIIADNWFEMDKDGAFAGEQVQFHYGKMDDPVAQNYTYMWNFGDGTTATGPNPTHIFLNKGKYDITLSVKNGCGESPDFHQQITIFDKPDCKAQFEWNPVGKDSLAFINLSLGDPANTDYLWNFGDGTESKEVEPIHFYNAAGVYDVSLTTRDTIFNCVNTATKKVQIGVVDCYADFEYFINNQTHEVSFYDKSQGNLSSWHWDFGDGSYSDIKEPIHTFTPGLYTVSLTVFNVTTGCQSTNLYDISVGEVDCHPEFSYFVDSLNVEFYDESLGASEFYWDFGDGEIDSVPDPIHTYVQPGIYTVYYTIWNDSTFCEGDMIRDIEVLGNDSSLCSVSFDYFVDSLTANFVVNSTTQFTDYYWELGYDAYDTDSLSYSFSQGGVYTVCLYTYDSISGCQAEYCEDIPIQTTAVACKADFSVRKGSSPGEFVFTDKSIGNPTDRSWDFGDNTFGSDTVEIHKYLEAGYYTVIYSIYDSISDCYSEIPKDVPVKLQDTATVSCKADFSYFINATDLKITLKDKSLGNVDTWYWTFGDGNYDASQNPVHVYGFPGEYTITLYVFNNTTGCTDQLAQTIYIGTKDCNLTADIGYLVDTAKIVKFTDQSSGDHQVSYWTFGDGNTANTTKVNHQYTAPGFYLVTLAVIDTVSGCNDHTSAFIQIGSTDCKADFEYTVNVDSLKVTYLNKSKNNSFNYWDFGNGHFSDEANPSFKYRAPGNHYNALVIGDSTGVCWDFTDKLIQVGEIKCDAEFEATVNPNTLVTEFNNKAQVRSTQLYWQFGDGSTSTLPDPKYRYSHPGYYLVSLYTNNDANNCYDYQEQVILVGNEGDDCEADFFYQANANTREVKFSDKSKGSDLTYLWNFGDGSTSTDQSPSYTFTDPGYQFVCLTVVNGKGISNMTCKDVQVGEGCLAQFRFKVDSLKVTFEDNSFGTPTNWRWAFGDSTKADSQNPVHEYQKAGDYLVFLGVKNASGCVNRTVQIVSVGNAEDTTFSANFAYTVDTTSTKPTRPVEMYGTGKGDSPKPAWNFGDAQKRGYATNDGTLRPTYNYANTDTTYHVCLTIEDPITGKSATACHDIKLGTGGSSYVKDLSSYVQMNVYPNPAKDFTKLNYSLTKNMDVKITIYDVSGNRIKEVLNQTRIAGAYNQDINLSGIASGTYFIEIRSSLGKISKKFVIRK